MIVDGALICPECGNEIDGSMADWMMQDGETRTFHCGECGTALTVTVHVKVDYTVRRESEK